MSLWKRHAAIPALAAAIALLLVLGFATNSAKDRGTFVLKDVTGSREALRGVAIGGELADGYHRTTFRLQDGSLRTNTAAFAQPSMPDTYVYIPGGDKRFGNREYSVQSSSPFEILRLSRHPGDTYFVPDAEARVNVPISVPHQDPNSSTFSNPLEYGIAETGDKAYFTVPVTFGTTGTSGIYELSFFEWGFASLTDRSEYDPRLVAEIDLGDNDSPEPPNVEVLGLEAVGGKLALLEVRGNELIVRSYDAASGNPLGEVSVSDFYLRGQGDSSSSLSPAAPDGLPSYGESYEAFNDVAQNMLYVSFRSGSGRRLVLSFDLRGNLRLADKTLVDFTGDGNDITLDRVQAMAFRDGTLYIAKSFLEAPAEAGAPTYDLSLPQHLYLYAFRQSKLVYQGELMTDLNDDTAAMNLGPVSPGGMPYDPMAYRHWMNISIE